MNKILHLPLKKQWYNMIESGEKREEYREIKPYWNKRLMGNTIGPLFSHRNGYETVNVNGYTHVCFHYGYTKRTMMFEIVDIIIGRGKTEWGAPEKDVYIIRFQ